MSANGGAFQSIGKTWSFHSVPGHLRMHLAVR
jgi:hypothetical protein